MKEFEIIGGSSYHTRLCAFCGRHGVLGPDPDQCFALRRPAHLYRHHDRPRLADPFWMRRPDNRAKLVSYLAPDPGDVRYLHKIHLLGFSWALVREGIGPRKKGHQL